MVGNVGMGAAGGEREVGRRRQRAVQIEQAAMGMFAQRGFDLVTMDEIAVAAGVSRATVFRYFPAKDDIVFSAEEAALAHLIELIRSMPSRGLDEIVLRQAEYLQSQGSAFEQRAAVVAASPRLSERFAVMRACWDAAVAAALAGRRGPDIPPDVEDLTVASATLAPLFAAFIARAHATTEESYLELVQRALERVGLPQPRSQRD